MKMLSIALMTCCCVSIGPGCGPTEPPTYRVFGEVQFNGKSVPRGYVNFIPADGTGRTASAKIAEGRYNALVSPGSQRVEILATEDSGPINPVMGQAPQRQYIPEKYNIETTLEIIVKESDNPQDFRLEP